MNFIPKSQDEFLLLALRYYDPTCISMLEFRKDLRMIKKIHRLLNEYSNGEEINIRVLLNCFLIVYNQFGEISSSLLFFNTSEKIINLACHFIIKLGRRDSLVDSMQINTDENLIKQLYTN